MPKLSPYKYLGVLLLGSATLYAQSGVDVSTAIRMQPAHNAKTADLSNVVVWLSPAQSVANPTPSSKMQYRLVQKDKQFHPHLLIVPTGSSVEFPNEDPFFHNVFSLFNGKRFDLGLYEAGTHRYVRFDREGVSYIFCNIHPEMGAVVLSLSTPYYAISTPDGAISLRNVPAGSYHLHIWSENARPLQGENDKLVQISTQGAHLDPIVLQLEPSPLLNHKNKFGTDYPAMPSSHY